jgi:ABC-2 type transport system ATP-binding protein
MVWLVLAWFFIADTHNMTTIEKDIDLRAKTEEATPVVAIETFDLRKSYTTGFWQNQRIESLKGCTLRVDRGEIFGLLGMNGAGKTTLLKSLLGIARPTGGKAVLLGKPLGDREVKQRIGYLPENPYFYDYVTGWELLEYTLTSNVKRQRIPALLDLVGLTKAAAKKKQLRQYSKGMLQRIGMAQALINDPELVFLDEPMSGLDPVGRKQMREIILSLNDAGKTVFFNSHVLNDVEKICHRIAILARGELIACGTLEELLTDSKRGFYVKGVGGNPEILERWLTDCNYDEFGWNGWLQGEVQEFLASLALMEGEIVELKRARISLEDYFMLQMQERGISMST